MIVRLRTRHRQTWLLLAFLVPAVLLMAWRTCRPAPVMERLPSAITEMSHP